MADKFLVDPGEFLHIFLKNSEELINFLEHIHKVKLDFKLNLKILKLKLFFLKNQISNSKVILNTLLELYINSFSNESSSNKDTNSVLKSKSLKTTKEEFSPKSDKIISFQEKRALEFLTQNHMLYDMNLALGICQLHNFRVNFGKFISFV